MNDIKNIRDRLIGIQTEIIQSNNSPRESPSFNDKLFNIRDKDIELYELLILMYDDCHLNSQINKTEYTILINKLTSSQLDTLQKLLILFEKELTIKDRFYLALTWSNIARLLLSWSFILIVMFSLHIINPDAYVAISDSIEHSVTFTIDKIIPTYNKD